jgi:hypothetical protein
MFIYVGGASCNGVRGISMCFARVVDPGSTRQGLEARIRVKRAGARAGVTASRMRRQDAWDEPANPMPQQQRLCCMKCGLRIAAR